MKKHFTLFSASLFLVLTISAQCAFVGATSAIGNSNVVTLTKPTAVVQNDLMIAAIHMGWCNGSVITAPVGWTLLASTINTGSGCGSGNTTPQLVTFYKIAGPSEPVTHIFTGNASQYLVGCIVAYSGVNTANPIDVFSSYGAQDACANIVANGVFTSSPNKRLVGIFFCSVNNSLNNIVPPNSMTERVDVGTTGNHPWGNENLEIADELQAPPGPTGNKVAALSGCSSTGWVTGAQLIALNCGSTTAMEEISPLAGFSVYPNPTTGIVEVAGTDGIQLPVRLELIDLFGRTILQEHFEGEKARLDLSALPRGVYLLRIIAGEKMNMLKVILD
ncbi:MAG: T9SS type A sorting domain-containing protein [Bacteroidia bacterium]|nr:T9SS type A sorting domain-containing protein [Bacteroidia bacterium]